MTVSGGELNEYVYYKSDNNGFKNIRGFFKIIQFDIISVGDSFSMCPEA